MTAPIISHLVAGLQGGIHAGSPLQAQPDLIPTSAANPKRLPLFDVLAIRLIVRRREKIQIPLHFLRRQTLAEFADATLGSSLPTHEWVGYFRLSLRDKSAGMGGAFGCRGNAPRPARDD